ncbi:hypothetical protein DFH27DRAFT_19799 [Peziza echinospora]|nr:hypothetical protein DFH27DRAFT_19799 [Peziza echinospora]
MWGIAVVVVMMMMMVVVVVGRRWRRRGPMSGGGGCAGERGGATQKLCPFHRGCVRAEERVGGGVYEGGCMRYLSDVSFLLPTTANYRMDDVPVVYMLLRAALRACVRACVASVR